MHRTNTAGYSFASEATLRQAHKLFDKRRVTVRRHPGVSRPVRTFRREDGCTAANLAAMPGNEEILAALIDFRDFVAEKFEQTATKAELRELKADVSELRTEVRAGFDRVDRRLERLESRVEDLGTRVKS